MLLNNETNVPPGAKIKVVGVGGGGGNVVNTMIREEMEGVEFVAVNTDIQALRFSLAPSKIQIGKLLTKGLGAGSDPDVGREAALEDHQELTKALSNCDMVFITAGMGGGTGTGAAAIVAQIARELGALTVGVVTKPFDFEGKRRRKHAELGLQRLKESVDALITIPNQRLISISSPGLAMLDAFKIADGVLVNAVRGITDIINVPGTLNVDFADVRTVMSSTGMALMGIGTAEGEGRASEAARRAITSPLLEDIDIEGATGILINITAGLNLPLAEVSEACAIIHDAAHEDANIKFGVVFDETMGNALRVTVIATGFPYDGNAAVEKPYIPRIPIISRPIVGASASPVASVPQAVAAPQAVVAPTPAPVAPVVVEAAPTPPAPPPAVVVETPAPVIEAAPQPEAQHVEAPIAEATAVEALPVETTAEEPVSTPTPQAIVESEELARWTLEALTETTSDSTITNAAAEALLDLPPPAMDPGFGAVSMLSDDLLESLSLESEPVLQEYRMEEAAPCAKAVESESNRPPLEAFFKDSAPAASAASELDRRIEEAIRLADNLKSSSLDEEDDLDIPAFLRNGMKDLPNR